MFEYKAEEMTARDVPHFDNGNTARLVEIVQKSHNLAKQREDLEGRLLKNQAEITATAGLLQEMLRTMYEEDEVVKYLADAILFTIGRNGLDPADKPPPF